jgi:Na+/H+-dicarboxylate symporter
VKIGGQFVGTIAFWLVLLSGLLFVASLGLYVVARWPGGVSFRRFARALLPVQALAVASRSSLVCLPKLLEAARNDLGQREEVAGIVLPLSVSTFKLNRMVSTPMNLFFLAYLYGIDLDPAITASLIFTAMIVSFATPGIPSGGKFTTLPIYLAAGIPVEGVVLLKAVDAIPDIFKTLINVTEDLTISTVVHRFALRRSLKTVDAGVAATTATDG